MLCALYGLSIPFFVEPFHLAFRIGRIGVQRASVLHARRLVARVDVGANWREREARWWQAGVATPTASG